MDRNEKARIAYRNLTPEKYQRLLEQKRARYAAMTPEARRAENEAAAQRRAREDPKKRAARKAVWDEIDHGRMQRGSCEVCGEPDAEAHHDDYDNPLEVRWLCTTHHKAVHR